MGYTYDSEAGEWYYLCAACREYLYAPTRRELQNQYIRHSLIKPMEVRKCPAIY